MNQNTRRQTRLPKLPWEERLKAERECWENGFIRVAGLDEAGRGPLAGPVVAAAFVIRPEFQIEGINDSKQLTPKKRAEYFEILTSGEWEYGVGIVEPAEIDRINIYQASRVAMGKALAMLSPQPDFLLVDALVVPGTAIPQNPLIHGDALSVAIAAASIIAKCTRDQMMEAYDGIYPGYGLAKHKGYPTPEHYLALRRLGPSPIHRRSFNLGDKAEKSMEWFAEDER